MKKIISQLFVAASMVFVAPVVMADSYRYMHVTIDTPWIIFLFLLFAVLAPFILMVILYWHTAIKRNAEAEEKAKSKAEDL